MILNVIPDQKFTTFLQDVFFEASADRFIFKVVCKKNSLKYAELNTNSVKVGFWYVFSREFAKDVKLSEAVVFHSMTLVTKLAVLRVPRGVPVLWRGWGFDYYHLIRSDNELFLPLTEKAFKRNTVYNLLTFNKLAYKELLKSIFSWMCLPLYPKIYGRIDYFSCCVPADFEEIKSKNEFFQANFFKLNYYSHEDVLLKGGDGKLLGRDILIGNSATFTNNHVDIFDILKNFKIGNRKLITPLSYGDDCYAEMVVKVGKKYFNNNFVPITSYMCLEEYNNTISDCGFVIMGHLRQQAMGNISTMLLKGAKVFLSKENSIYSMYIDMGVKIFSLEEDLSEDALKDELNSNDKENNRTLLLNYWAREKAVQDVENLMDALKG